MNKIGWCDSTFNPVWGCRNHCEYCYARKIAGFRYNQMADKEYSYLKPQGVTYFYAGNFANRLRHFVPTFIESNFYKKLPKKPQRIFVGSMSEIAHWKLEWIEMVIEKIKQYPQHTFQFLTSFPQVYHSWVFPPNCWLGITVTGDNTFNNMWGQYLLNKGQRGYRNIRFISFEPLLKEIRPNPLEVGWVIIGAESGNRKGKIIPKKEWIEKIVNYCRDRDIPIYLKDSLKNIYPEEIKMFPEMIKC